VFRDYERQEVVCTNCGRVIGKPEDMDPGLPRAIGLPPAEQIRTANRLGLNLSRKTKKIIRQRPKKTCLICERQYRPTGNYQKYCLRCKRAQLKALRKYKRHKQRHTARIRRLKLEMKMIDSKRKKLNQEKRVKKERIKKERRILKNIHFPQFLHRSPFSKS